jgi:hypothetical protein
MNNSWLGRTATLILTFSLIAFPAAADDISRAIADVRISAASFNPSLGQSVTYTVQLDADGRITAEIVDRTGAPVRTIAKDLVVKKGEHVLHWDGRDERATTVPDEAYAIRVGLSAGDVRVGFSQPDHPHETLIMPKYYDRKRGVIAYELPAASRVRIDAIARGDTPLRVAVVSDAPRPAGVVLDYWNGEAEDGAWLPGLPGFALEVRAVPLPPATVITYGNERTSAGANPAGQS